MATMGFEAGKQTNAVELSYGEETQWGVNPGVPFQAIRFTGGDQFSGSKTRQRPSEIRTDHQVSAAVTTQEQASAGFSGALSFGTYDDLLAGLLMGDWTPPVAINASDIAADDVGGAFTSTVTDFTGQNIRIGQWIKVSGFTTAGNNGFFQVTSIAADTLGVSPSPVAAEAAGDVVALSGSMLRNGAAFKSFYFQKKVGSGIFFTYPGTYFTGGSINIQTRQFAEITMSGASKLEVKETGSQSTGAVLSAPSGRVHDTVGNLTTPTLDGVALSSAATGLEVSFSKDGAGADYGIGSAAAQGMIQGALTVTGRLRMFFKTTAEYDLFAAETGHVISYRTADDTGNTYVVTLLSATIMNPAITAGAPNQAMVAEFELEGNPSEVFGATVQIDRIPA